MIKPSPSFLAIILTSSIGPCSPCPPSLGIPITDDAGVREFVDALHREGIDLSLPDVISIVNLIRAEYGSEDLNKEGPQTNGPTKEQAGAKQQEPGHQLVHQEEGQDDMNSYYMLGTILPREEPKALPLWLSLKYAFFTLLFLALAIIWHHYGPYP